MFVVFEGLDFTGKSTLIEALKVRNPEWVFTREPGGTDCQVSNDIRDYVLSGGFEIPPVTETYLFAGARAEHVEKINDWLDEDNIVICDRFVHSSMFYQGIIKGVGPQTVKSINDYALNELTPDLIFYVICSEAERNRRMNDREIVNEMDELSLKGSYIEQLVEYYSIIKDDTDDNTRLVIINTTDRDTARCVSEIEYEIKKHSIMM